MVNTSGTSGACEDQFKMTVLRLVLGDHLTRSALADIDLARDVG